MSLCLSLPVASQVNSAHQSAALEMLRHSGFYERFPQLHSVVVISFVQSNPGYRVYADLIEELLAKHITADQIAEQTADKLTEQFSLQELNDINAFLQSSSGHKFAETLSLLSEYTALSYTAELKKLVPQIAAVIKTRRQAINEEAHRKNREERLIHQEYLRSRRSQ